MDNKKEINEFDEYYKKKGDYNRKLQERKDKILSQNISIKEKRIKIQKIKLPCIFCKRPVNTIFENSDGQINAKCGSVNNPCDTTLKIENNGYFLLDKINSIFEELLEINKTKINRLKYQTLYSFLSREKSSEKFKKLVNEYNENMACYITHLRKYNDVIEQKEKNELLSETLVEFENFIQSIKLTNKQFEETKQRIVLTESIDSMVENIIPLLKKIRTLKYSHTELIQNKDGNENKTTNYLVTKSIPYNSLEYKFETNNNVEINVENESDNSESSDDDSD